MLQLFEILAPLSLRFSLCLAPQSLCLADPTAVSHCYFYPRLVILVRGWGAKPGIHFLCQWVSGKWLSSVSLSFLICSSWPGMYYSPSSRDKFLKLPLPQLQWVFIIVEDISISLSTADRTSRKKK